MSLFNKIQCFNILNVKNVNFENYIKKIINEILKLRQHSPN